MKIGKPHDHYDTIDDQLQEDFKKLDEEEEMHMFNGAGAKPDSIKQKLQQASELNQLGTNRRS